MNITDGVAYYTITSDSAETAQDLQDSLSDSTSVDTLSDAVSDSLPVNVNSVNVDEEITAEVVVTVDTSDASNNLNNAAETLEEEFEEQGYSADAESNFNKDVFERKKFSCPNFGDSSVSCF